MTDESKMTMAERVRLAKAKVAAEGGPKIVDEPKRPSNMYAEDETKIVSDSTVAKAKVAGKFAAMAGKSLVEKSKEAAEVAAAKAKAALAKREARNKEEAELAAARVAKMAADKEAELLAEQARLAEVEAGPAEPVVPLADNEHAQEAHEEIDQAIDETFDQAVEVKQVSAADDESLDAVNEEVPLAPAAPTAKVSAESVHQAVAPAAQYSSDAPVKMQGKRNLLIIVGAILIASILGGAYWFTQQTDAPSQAPTEAPADVIEAPTSVEVKVNAKPAPSIQVEPVAVQEQPDMLEPAGETPTDPVASNATSEAVEDSVAVIEEPKIETKPVPSPAAVAPKAAPSPKPVAPKPKVARPTPAKPKAAPVPQEPTWQDEAMAELDAFEKQLGG
ncbi:hypothetical protein [Novilysobacter arseniciresistens]|uniref:hypothetical protein n=1 Tax=Novilysobacter arseniciresistens TaxID=1385522 RepID=UPI00126A2989|nr:hypothetical protein [Lysobacter arseniciresistens]